MTNSMASALSFSDLRYFSTIVVTAAALILCPFGGFAQPMHQGDEEEPRLLFLGWDYSGLTFDEQLSALLVLEPQRVRELSPQEATPQGEQSATMAKLAIENPLEYAKLVSAVTEAPLSEANQAARFFIANPHAYQTLLDANRSEESNVDRLARLSIVMPVEFGQYVKQTQTAEEQVAEEKVRAEANLRPRMPTPIFEEVSNVQPEPQR